MLWRPINGPQVFNQLDQASQTVGELLIGYASLVVAGWYFVMAV
jgi:hypothetical protein